jgi:membrane protease YdiL (CAAX protease family)
MAFAPAIAAVGLAYAGNGSTDARALLRRCFDYGRIGSKVWYLPALLLPPAIMAAAYGLMRWSGVPMPEPGIPLPAVLALFLAFLVGGLGEELGWCGYAIEPLQARWGALGASVLLGLVWAAWHLVPLLQVHRAPAWIAWWSLATVGTRVLTTWIYNNTGRSVFAAALFHAMGNMGWMLFPSWGSHYDPRFVAPVVVVAAAVVTAAWGPRTLAGYRKCWTGSSAGLV